MLCAGVPHCHFGQTSAGGEGRGSLLGHGSESGRHNRIPRKRILHLVMHFWSFFLNEFLAAEVLVCRRVDYNPPFK
jgi:hypothetical protein